MTNTTSKLLTTAEMHISSINLKLIIRLNRKNINLSLKKPLYAFVRSLSITETLQNCSYKQPIGVLEGKGCV